MRIPSNRVMLVWVAWALAMPCVPADAQSDPPVNREFLVLSDGATQCGEFVTSSRADQAHMTEWVLGFISGLNAGSAGRHRLIGHDYDVHAIPGWLDSYCRSHALDTLENAALALRDDFVAHGMIGQ
jgi:hypothetical protein